MKALLFRELKSVFCSSVGAFFSLAFLLSIGFMLWFFSGNYNLIERGYADISPFFTLAPILLAILIPSLTMRLFAEEKRNKTLDILFSRPVGSLTIYGSKYIATLIFVFATILATFIYIYSIYQLANPIGNIDIQSILASYLSLIIIAAIFIAIGLFGSIISKNQIVALITSIFLCVFTYYGFDLISSLFQSGKIQSSISSFGLWNHYKLMQRGVIYISDLITTANYLIIFVLISLLYLKARKRIIIFSIIIICILNIIFCLLPNYKFDFTADKKYTLDDFSVKLLDKVKSKEPLEIIIYLNGDLNSGFQHLKNAVNDMLSDININTNNNIRLKNINPYQYFNSEEAAYESFYKKGMAGIMLNEIDREGKASKKIIYPYAEITNRTDTLLIPLLKNIKGYTAEENINASIESLEFEFIDAINLLNEDNNKVIAFIEGHDEIPREYIYDAEEQLAKYYSINRGEIGNEVGILDQFAAIIIAGPLKKYTETEKYIIDQYIMSGGKVFWLIDGTYYSKEDLMTKGYSASIKNDMNLDDMLFGYGVRINADLIQDMQSTLTYVINDDNIQSTSTLPNYFEPLLLPSYDHPVTKSIKDVKANFASSLDAVNSSTNIKKNILLTTSPHTHLLKVPEPIDFDIEKIQNNKNYFNQSFVPVAISLEGKFNSIFRNRMIPDSVTASQEYITINEGKNTRMIVVSSSSIITNEIVGQGSSSQILPMGYDKISKQQFGNRDFIVNAVNWLTDDNGELMSLRTKQQKLRILNKKLAYENRDILAVINIGLPILFMAIIMLSIFLFRKKKYTK